MEEESADERTIRELREALQKLVAAVNDGDKEAILSAMRDAAGISEWPDW